MIVDVTPGQLGIEPEAIIRCVASLRMFVAAHNSVRPYECVTGEELELLEEAANDLETFHVKFKAFLEMDKGGKDK